jgi:hypothetical protein
MIREDNNQDTRGKATRRGLIERLKSIYGGVVGGCRMEEILSLSGLGGSSLPGRGYRFQLTGCIST